MATLFLFQSTPSENWRDDRQRTKTRRTKNCPGMESNEVPKRGEGGR